MAWGLLLVALRCWRETQPDLLQDAPDTERPNRDVLIAIGAVTTAGIDCMINYVQDQRLTATFNDYRVLQCWLRLGKHRGSNSEGDTVPCVTSPSVRGRSDRQSSVTERLGKVGMTPCSWLGAWVCQSQGLPGFKTRVDDPEFGVAAGKIGCSRSRRTPGLFG